MNPFDLPEWRAMVAAVKAAPADDLPRLVAADWLDEHGQPERAEFIRVQCELGRLDPHAECGGYYCQTYDTGNVMHVDCQGERLRNRERALLIDFPAAPYWEAPADLTETHPHREPMRDAAGIRCHGKGVREVRLTYASGWVSRVDCEAAVWWGQTCGRCGGRDTYAAVLGTCPVCGGTGRTAAIGRRIVAAHPVAEVLLSGVEPYYNGGGYCWYDGGRPEPQRGGHSANLPTDVYRRLDHRVARRSGQRWPAYADRGEAVRCLSAAALAWATG